MAYHYSQAAKTNAKHEKAWLRKKAKQRSLSAQIAFARILSMQTQPQSNSSNDAANPANETDRVEEFASRAGSRQRAEKIFTDSARQ